MCFNPQLLKKGIVISSGNRMLRKIERFNPQLLKKGIVISTVNGSTETYINVSILNSLRKEL